VTAHGVLQPSVSFLFELELCVYLYFHTMYVSSGPAIHATNQRITAKGEK